MYPKELEDLLKEYLTDGIITAQERKVLLKKAESLGVDPDEFDLYIDAQQQKSDQETDAAVRKQRGKACPFCGGTIPALTDKCPHCGESITPEASEELTEILDKLETALVKFKSGENIYKTQAEVERYVRKARMYYGNNPRVEKLLVEIENESKNVKKNVWVRNILGNLTRHKYSSIVAIIVVLLVSFFSIRACCNFVGDLRDEAQKKLNISTRDEVLTEVTDMVTSGKLEEADKYLTTLHLPDNGNTEELYDPVYLVLVNAYIKKGDYASAENIASVFESKIGGFNYFSESNVKAAIYQLNKRQEEAQVQGSEQEQNKENNQESDEDSISW